jgi:hypothetical protein
VAISSPDGRYAPPPGADDAPARRALDRRLAPDHLARRLDRAVARLDLAAFVAGYGRTGSSPHRPDLRVRVRRQVGVLALGHDLLTLLAEEKKPRAENAAVSPEKVPA